MALNRFQLDAARLLLVKSPLRRRRRFARRHGAGNPRLGKGTISPRPSPNRSWRRKHFPRGVRVHVLTTELQRSRTNPGALTGKRTRHCAYAIRTGVPAGRPAEGTRSLCGVQRRRAPQLDRAIRKRRRRAESGPVRAVWPHSAGRSRRGYSSNACHALCSSLR